MFKQIKKEIADINNHVEHMEYMPPYSTNAEDNFNELLKLTARSNPRFKISGDHTCFLIQANANNIIIGVLLAVLLFPTTVLLFQNFTSPIYWLVEFVVLLGLFLLFRYYPSSYDIEVDSFQKILTITSNNLIGRFIIPPLNIPYAEVTEFTSRAITKTGKGISHEISRIYVKYRGQSKQIIELPKGPIYFVNDKVFVSCLTAIIKHGA